MSDIWYTKKEGTKYYQMAVTERGYSGILSTLGKIDRFESVLYKKTLEDSLIKSIVPIENFREKSSFVLGQERAQSMLDNGFTKKQYADFLRNLNINIKKKIENTELSEIIKHI